MKKTSLICVVIAVMIILVAWVTFSKTSIASKRALTIGTVRAVGAALHTEAKDNQKLINTLDNSTEQKWQILSKQTYDEIIENICLRHNLDAPKDWKPSMPLIDIWGNRFAVLCREFSGVTDFVVISAGPDGTFCTTDDIASEYKLPETIQMSCDDLKAYHN